MAAESTISAPPSAPIAEKSILSAMLKHPDTLIRRVLAEGITVEAFWHHGVLFREIVDYHSTAGSTNGEIELTSFVQHLHLEGRLDRVGGPAEVSGIYTYQPTAEGWSKWVEMLREAHARRMALDASRKLAEAGDSGEAVEELCSALEAIRKTVTGAKRSVGIREAADDFADRLRRSHASGEIPGHSTGILPLDGISGGMRDGEFWVVGGRPSRGKSVLMLQIAAEFISRGEPVVVFSLEMMAHEIVGRLVSVSGKVNYGAITQPRTARKTELESISAVVRMLASSPLWIDASSNQTIETISAEAVRLRDMNGGKIGLVVVDYLQLLRGGRGRNETREEEIARVSGSLKQLAKELSCPVLSASQLNDQGQTRESRAIEQDADALLLILEDGVKVMKLRNGPRNDVLPLYLDGKFQRFVQVQS
jgi:replicative DNA helicase